MKKVQRVLTSLRATEGLFAIQTTSPESFATCKRVHIHDTTERIPSLVKAEDSHPFLLFHLWSNEVATRRLYILWKDVEGMRKAGSVLHSPSWKLGPKKRGISGPGTIQL